MATILRTGEKSNPEKRKFLNCFARCAILGGTLLLACAPKDKPPQSPPVQSEMKKPFEQEKPTIIFHDTISSQYKVPPSVINAGPVVAPTGNAPIFRATVSSQQKETVKTDVPVDQTKRETK